MKKLGKLTISSKNLMKEQELINLKGGYGGTGCDAQASTCEGSCTITINGQTFQGTCTRRADLWNLCVCVQN